MSKKVPARTATDCTGTSTPSALTVNALAGGTLTGPISRFSLKVSASELPCAPTSALAGIGGVPSAVELLSTSKSVKASASLPEVSSITVPDSDTA